MEGLVFATGRRPARAVAVSGAFAAWTADLATVRAAIVLGVFVIPIAEERTLGVFIVGGEVVEGLPKVEAGRDTVGSIPIEVPALDIGLLDEGVLEGDRLAMPACKSLEGELTWDLLRATAAAADEDVGGLVEDGLLRIELALTGLKAERDGVLDEAALVRESGTTGDSTELISCSSNT